MNKTIGMAKYTEEYLKSITAEGTDIPILSKEVKDFKDYEVYRDFLVTQDLSYINSEKGLYKSRVSNGLKFDLGYSTESISMMSKENKGNFIINTGSTGTGVTIHKNVMLSLLMQRYSPVELKIIHVGNSSDKELYTTQHMDNSTRLTELEEIMDCREEFIKFLGCNSVVDIYKRHKFIIPTILVVFDVNEITDIMERIIGDIVSRPELGVGVLLNSTDISELPWSFLEYKPVIVCSNSRENVFHIEAVPALTNSLVGVSLDCETINDVVTVPYASDEVLLKLVDNMRATDVQVNPYKVNKISIAPEYKYVQVTELNSSIVKDLEYNNNLLKSEGLIVPYDNRSQNVNYKNKFIPLQLGKDLKTTKHTNLMISGVSGSGKSCYLDSIIYNLIKNYTDEDVNIYYLDGKVIEAKKFVRMEVSPHFRYLSGVARWYRVSEEISKLYKVVDNRMGLLKDSGNLNMEDFMENCNIKIPTIVLILDEIIPRVESMPDGDTKSRCVDELKFIVKSSILANVQVIISQQEYRESVLFDSLSWFFPVKVNLTPNAELSDMIASTKSVRIDMGLNSGITKHNIEYISIDKMSSTIREYNKNNFTPDSSLELHF